MVADSRLCVCVCIITCREVSSTVTTGAYIEQGSTGVGRGRCSVPLGNSRDLGTLRILVVTDHLPPGPLVWAEPGMRVTKQLKDPLRLSQGELPAWTWEGGREQVTNVLVLESRPHGRWPDLGSQPTSLGSKTQIFP